MARIDTVDLDDRHSRRGAPRVSKPKLTKLFLALPMRQSQYYFGGEEVNRPASGGTLLRLRLMKLNDPSKPHGICWKCGSRRWLNFIHSLPQRMVSIVIVWSSLLPAMSLPRSWR